MNKGKRRERRKEGWTVSRMKDMQRLRRIFEDGGGHCKFFLLRGK